MQTDKLGNLIHAYDDALQNKKRENWTLAEMLLKLDVELISLISQEQDSGKEHYYSPIVK